MLLNNERRKTFEDLRILLIGINYIFKTERKGLAKEFMGQLFG